MWEGWELRPGNGTGGFNSTYLTVMNDLASMLGEAGIWSIFDVHQDSMSRIFCGEGIPDDYVAPGNIPPALQFPWPLPFNITPGPDGYPNLTQ